MPKDCEDPLPPGPPLSSARRCRLPAVVVRLPLSSALRCRLPAIVVCLPPPSSPEL